jgi:hypothetical protein
LIIGGLYLGLGSRYPLLSFTFLVIGGKGAGRWIRLGVGFVNDLGSKYPDGVVWGELFAVGGAGAGLVVVEW